MPKAATKKPRRRSAVERPALPEPMRRAFLTASTPSAARGTGPRGGLTTATGAGTIRVSAYLEPETWRKLRQRGMDEGVTAAELIRQAVALFLRD